MAMRLFLIYAVVELAVLVALASTIGFGWTVLLLAGTFLLGLVLAGSQLRRHIRRLRSGLTVADAQGAVTDSVLVALGTVLVVIPGPASSVLGALLLLPPTRAAARPVLTAMAARRAPLIVGVSTVGSTAARRARHGDYIDGEVIDIDADVIDADADVVDGDADVIDGEGRTARRTDDVPPTRVQLPRLPE